jgi:hypothetical protein
MTILSHGVNDAKILEHCRGNQKRGNEQIQERLYSVETRIKMTRRLGRKQKRKKRRWHNAAEGISIL